MSSPHRWKFFRQGGFDQVVLKKGEDIAALAELDQKLWVALACPVKQLNLPAPFLEALDDNKDGRIRASEVVAIAQWLKEALKDLELVVSPPEALPLSALRDDTELGRSLRASAQHALEAVGRGDAPQVALADIADTGELFRKTRFNGDGVITLASAEEEAHKTLITQMQDCLGADEDRSGEPGVSAEKIQAFFEAARARHAWLQAAPAQGALGEAVDVEALLDAWLAVEEKLADWFTRVRLAAFDERAQEHLARAAETWAEVATRSLSAQDDQIADFPIAKLAAQPTLSLVVGLNPAWADRVEALRAQVVRPLLGEQETLSWADFEAIRQRVGAYVEWRGTQAGVELADLGAERIAQLAEAQELEAALLALVAEDEAHRPQAEGIEAVQRLLLLVAHFYQFLCNFTNFSELYQGKTQALFVAGTLFLDGREAQLCLAVDDIDAHSAVANLSYAYLVYCVCKRQGEDGGERNIVAAFTNGDSDFLRPGRNGLFYDRDGKDWDATIVKVAEAPISIRQAFFSPYKRVARFVGEQVESFASAREKAVEESSSARVGAAVGGVTGTGEAPPPDAPPPPPAGSTSFDIARFAGIFAAVGMALGAIGTAVAAVLAGFMGLKFWQMPLAVGGALLLISGPSMLLAWMKLRQRNLGPLLDAGGWAINARVRLNVPFGATLTPIAQLPQGARREGRDPYADPQPSWKRWALLLLIAVALSALWELGLPRWIGLQ